MPLKKQDRISGHQENSQDEMLADDSDIFKNINPNLTLEIRQGDTNYTPSTPSSPGCVSIESNRGGVGSVNFEVISTDTVKEGRSSHVIYRILIYGHGIEKTPGIIEKRYSDFEKFNVKLRQKFPELMESVAFPGKLLMGNFKIKTIARRSRAFEQYLNHLMSVNNIRFSIETRKFFYENEMNFANKMLISQNYTDAIALFEKCLPIQEKVMGSMHDDVVKTLCSIVACYQTIGNRERALRYSNTALLCISDNSEDPYYLPLLHTAIYLHWMLGTEKAHLEAKLGELRKKGISTETNTNLLDTVLREVKS